MTEVFEMPAAEDGIRHLGKIIGVPVVLTVGGAVAGVTTGPVLIWLLRQLHSEVHKEDLPVTNLFCAEDQRDFYVWVDPSNWFIRHQIQETGSFFPVHPENLEEALMFVPNPKFRGLVSPFQNNLLRQYVAEYQLEVARQTYYPKYPCRLRAIFFVLVAGKTCRP